MSTWFPKLYDPLMEPLEKRFLSDLRKKMIHKAKGRVLEVGSGTGLNFPYYEEVYQVIAIEPADLMRRRSLNRAREAKVPVEVYDFRAEELPIPDNEFDTVIGTLVLCTIPDPVRALQEMRRVGKPDGNMIFLEHVRLDHPVLGRLQDFLTPAWKRLCDGCHLNRNTLELVIQSGLQITRVEEFANGLFLVIEAVNQKRSENGY